MTTFKEVTDRVHSLLHSYVGVQEQVTWLTADCTDTATTLQVHDSDAVSVGISEIGDELIHVSGSDSGTLTLAPFGRGFRGTTAAAHATNDKVTFNPLFPRIEIKRAINQVLASTFPILYQTKSTTFTMVYGQATYALPADCTAVQKVLWEVVGPSKFWETHFDWDFEPNSQEASGKALNLFAGPMPGRTVKVVYDANFSQFAADSDTFTTVGFPESALDVLLYGATAQLLRFVDMSRLQTVSVENTSRSTLVATGDAAKVANQLYAMYQQRLGEERKKLLDLNPPQMHYQR